MESEVADLVGSLGAKQEIRAIVFTGRGFRAGADLSGGAGNVEGAPPTQRPGPERFKFLWDSPKPLVAAINGPAAGVGLSIALHCDLRFIADNASITTAFAQARTHRGARLGLAARKIGWLPEFGRSPDVGTES